MMYVDHECLFMFQSFINHRLFYITLCNIYILIIIVHVFPYILSKFPYIFPIFPLYFPYFHLYFACFSWFFGEEVDFVTPYFSCFLFFSHKNTSKWTHWIYVFVCMCIHVGHGANECSRGLTIVTYTIRRGFPLTIHENHHIFIHIYLYLP